ncbi:kinase-like domain-containing protein [Suillus subalutaceus]|uniref:kinase-like domain-containing protein n=1 Tax=Suillus subalutaceus TaxID=48586 RepID=UPI001B87BFAC|nr:kinase-like domain-containing protein [Suillus subalutaceus]KAG1841813.1 kinase-like domain-containing protein [Suillus subalutaceus]
MTESCKSNTQLTSARLVAANRWGDEWHTWNAYNKQSDWERKHNGYVFEYLEPHSFDLSAVEPPSIYQNLLLYNQLTADYSWTDVTFAVNWALKLRKFDRAHEARQRSLLLPDSSFCGNIPTFDENIKESALILGSMKVPFDDIWDYDNEPYVELDLIPDYMSPVSAPSTRVIAFDLFGTILDRDGAINDAMRLLSPTHPDRHRLSELYLECELMRHRDNSDAPYTAIVRQALEDVCILEAPLSELVLREAVQTILQPGLYADADAAVGTLLDQGYALIGLPIPDAKSFSLPQLPSGLNVNDEPLPLSNLFSQNHSMFSGFLERCRLACSTAEKNQVLVVTSSCYQVMEPASMAGFPTVLVRRPGDLGSGVNLRTSQPTLLIDGLQALPVKLQNTSLVHCPSPPRMQPHIGFLTPPARVRGMYQMTKLLGAGSSGYVTSAFHVLTGSEVALKSGTASEDTPDMPCVVLYEALVYSLLRGHPGIPSFKWSGLDRGSYVLVLEQLGANLEQLRRLSRSELPRKTVIMLGVQMFNRVEFAHSRGVILRDIRPENFAMGVGEKSHIVYLFDFGLAKLYIDPSTGVHIPYREGRDALGTMPYSSYNVHFGREQGRRDDLEALGNVLLSFLHGCLPWQEIYAPNEEAYLRRMGEMKAGSAAFCDLLARSPPEFTTYFDHCRSLEFEDKPNYALLRQLFSQMMEKEGWTGDTRFDPLDGSTDIGTLVPEEYKFDVRFTKGDLTTLQVMIPRFLWRRKIVSRAKEKESRP